MCVLKSELSKRRNIETTSPGSSLLTTIRAGSSTSPPQNGSTNAPWNYFEIISFTCAAATKGLSMPRAVDLTFPLN
jgi:hypothetical protein